MLELSLVSECSTLPLRYLRRCFLLMWNWWSYRFWAGFLALDSYERWKANMSQDWIICDDYRMFIFYFDGLMNISNSLFWTQMSFRWRIRNYFFYSGRKFNMKDNRRKSSQFHCKLELRRSWLVSYRVLIQRSLKTDGIRMFMCREILTVL